MKTTPLFNDNKTIRIIFGINKPQSGSYPADNPEFKFNENTMIICIVDEITLKQLKEIFLNEETFVNTFPVDHYIEGSKPTTKLISILDRIMELVDDGNAWAEFKIVSIYTFNNYPNNKINRGEQ